MHGPMTWPLRWIVDLFNTIAAWYYRRKYGAAARQLGRLSHEKDGRQGFIIIEIDGLAYEYLRQALRQGYMPYLARLLVGRKLRLARWRCGLPSTTPASQAGILYGNNWDIPGFRWYDKQRQSPILCKLPGTVRAIQDRISVGRTGLLRGGSSYTNMFDGDARLALFTLSALGRDRLFENVRGLGFLALFALSPLRIVKIVVLSFWTWLVYALKHLLALLRPATPHFRLLGPLFEIFNNVIFREVTTFSVMVDIYRGMPAIYAAYTGYDEIAHYFGANSREAFRALRELDKQVRQIDRIRQLYQQRQYDLYIVSDHGMTASVSFQRAYGQALEQFIAEQTGEEVREGGTENNAKGLSPAWTYFLLDEIQALEARSQRPLSARLLRATRRRLEQRLRAGTLEDEWDLTRRGDIAVRNSGSLSHVYFNIAARPVDLSEVAVLYPRILELLVTHDGIGLVAGREAEDVAILGRSGALWCGPYGRRVEGTDPLASYHDPEWAAEQIVRIARFPHAGDLILFGAWDGNLVVSFEGQVARHGGLGGPQDWPFIAFPHNGRFSARRIRNATDLYTQFAAVYGGHDQDSRRANL